MATLARERPIENESDDVDYARRAMFWTGFGANPKTRRSKRAKAVEPLILCGHGVSIRIDGGTLHIRNGFTHYPQRQETFRFFKGDADLPPRIIVLDGSGTITFDVLSWLAEQKIPLIKIDWTGAVQSVLGGESFAANRHRVAWQTETLSDPRKRMEFCNRLIARKIEGCIRTLEKSIRKSGAWEKAMRRAYADLTELELNPPQEVGALRTLEANSAAAYFRAWREIPLKWANSARHPIPDDWRSIGARTSRFNLAGNRNASHPVNAMLNYAYGALQSQLQIQAIADGYDPTIGIMHFEREGSPAFIFDLMEPERPKADRAIIDFLKSETLHPADFTIRGDGVVRVNPELANYIARVAAVVMTDRLTATEEH